MDKAGVENPEAYCCLKANAADSPLHSTPLPQKHLGMKHKVKKRVKVITSANERGYARTVTNSK